MEYPKLTLSANIKRTGSRFNTQPVTTEEIQIAKNYASALASSLLTGAFSSIHLIFFFKLWWWVVCELAWSVGTFHAY